GRELCDSGACCRPAHGLRPLPPGVGQVGDGMGDGDGSPVTSAGRRVRGSTVRSVRCAVPTQVGKPPAPGSVMRATSDEVEHAASQRPGHRGPRGREETWPVTPAASAQLPDVVPSAGSRWHEPLQPAPALMLHHALPGAAAELTDPDGDALTLTTDAQGTLIACTTDGDGITVGPVPAAVLRQALRESAGAAPPAVAQV